MRAPDELLCAIWLPMPRAGFIGRFFKFGTRPALDISAISIGIGGVLRGRRAHGRARRVRRRRAGADARPRTEAALEGAALDAATIARIADVARDEVRPIDDVRATAWYRRELVFNMTKRMLDDVAQA